MSTRHRRKRGGRRRSPKGGDVATVPKKVYADFLESRNDPDGGKWSREQLKAEQEFEYNTYTKHFRKAKLDIVHLKHLRKFKPNVMKARQEHCTDGYIGRVCQSTGSRKVDVTALGDEYASDEEILPENVEKLPPSHAPIGMDSINSPAYTSTFKGLEMHKVFKRWTGGGWRKGKMHGEGCYVFSGGGVGKGLWSESRMNGKGTMSLPDGSKYEGNFLKGVFYGTGTMTYPSGARYTGRWLEGRRHGRGKMVFASGQTYEGQFFRGEYHGLGKLVSTAGHSYEGEFRGGLIKGGGTLKLSDGVKVQRNWPRSTLREAIDIVRSDMRIAAEVKQIEMDVLLGPIRRIRLRQYVEAVREQIQFEKEEEKRIEKEERRKLEVERRKKIIEAKKVMLEDITKGKGGDSDSDEDETDSSAEEEEEEKEEKDRSLAVV